MAHAHADLQMVDRPRDRVDAHRASASLVELSGEQDAATAGFVKAALRRAALDGRDVIVDLHAVTFMDASTIGALVLARHDLESHGHTMALRSPSRVAGRLVTLCGLDDMVEGAAPKAPPRRALGTWVAVPPAAPGRTQSRTGDGS